MMPTNSRERLFQEAARTCTRTWVFLAYEKGVVKRHPPKFSEAVNVRAHEDGVTVREPIARASPSWRPVVICYGSGRV